MIRLIEIEPDEWEVIPFPAKPGRIFVEFSSNLRIDFGVVDNKNLKAFEDDAEDFKTVFWSENNTGLEFQIEVGSNPFYLILWNANETRKGAVAYRFSE